MKQILLVDDIPLGILAGKLAAYPTVAVSKIGNALGLSLYQGETFDPIDRRGRIAVLPDISLKWEPIL